MTTDSTIVSFDNEPLMLVDSNDVVIGYEEKALAHQGEGQLHRAFSIFLLNPAPTVYNICISTFLVHQMLVRL